MPKSTPRAERVADLIQEQLAFLLRKEVHDPRLSTVTFTCVRLTPDLKQAKIFFTTLNPADRKPVEAAFAKASGYLRHLLAKTMELRYVPKLHFLYDEAIERSAELSSLIDNAVRKDQKLNPSDNDIQDEDE